MTWALPRTWVAGEMTTAALLNQDVRDNMLALVPQSGFVVTSETRTATTYGDLATVGPAVTVNTLGEAYVILGTFTTNSNASAFSTASHAVSGASTIAASDTFQLAVKCIGATFNVYTSVIYKRTDLTAGSNTFTAKYKVTAGTGTWSARSIIVIPVGPSS